MNEKFVIPYLSFLLFSISLLILICLRTKYFLKFDLKSSSLIEYNIDNLYYLQIKTSLEKSGEFVNSIKQIIN